VREEVWRWTGWKFRTQEKESVKMRYEGSGEYDEVRREDEEDCFPEDQLYRSCSHRMAFR
jgi:hypothetical protein